MAISEQKSASTTNVNLQDILKKIETPKIPTSNAFTGEREKLRSFLTKLDLYIEFNIDKFQFEMNKRLFAVAHLTDAAFDWVDPKLHEFLEKSLKKKMKDRKSIFSDFKRFKEEIRKAFEVVDEKRAAERRLHVLRQNESAVKYSIEFQRIAALTNWNDDALTSQYYWELKKAIKNEIFRMNRSEKLQEMINAFINIDSRQWERRMKRTEQRTPKKWFRSNITRHREDSMDLDAIEKRRYTKKEKRAEHGRQKRRFDKPQPRREETRECFNCEKTEHLARTCKKSQKEKKDLATAKKNNSVMHDASAHDSLTWTACYDDECWTHLSSKQRSGWYSQKPRGKKREEYDTTSSERLETIIREENLDAIEIDTKEVEEIDTREAQKQENNTWMYLDFDADSEDIDAWEVDMKMKNRYSHLENQQREAKEERLAEQKKILEEKRTILKEKARERETREEKVLKRKIHQQVKKLASSISKGKNTRRQLNELLESINEALQKESNSTVASLKTQRTRQIVSLRILNEYTTRCQRRIIYEEEYISSRFLQKATVLTKELQKEYEQYDLVLHPNKKVENYSQNFINLRYFDESKRFRDAETKNCELPRRD